MTAPGRGFTPSRPSDAGQSRPSPVSPAPSERTGEIDYPPRPASRAPTFRGSLSSATSERPWAGHTSNTPTGAVVPFPPWPRTTQASTDPLSSHLPQSMSKSLPQVADKRPQGPNAPFHREGPEGPVPIPLEDEENVLRLYYGLTELELLDNILQSGEMSLLGESEWIYVQTTTLLHRQQFELTLGRLRHRQQSASRVTPMEVDALIRLAERYQRSSDALSRGIQMRESIQVQVNSKGDTQILPPRGPLGYAHLDQTSTQARQLLHRWMGEPSKSMGASCAFVADHWQWTQAEETRALLRLAILCLLLSLGNMMRRRILLHSRCEHTARYRAYRRLLSMWHAIRRGLSSEVLGEEVSLRLSAHLLKESQETPRMEPARATPISANGAARLINPSPPSPARGSGSASLGRQPCPGPASPSSGPFSVPGKRGHESSSEVVDPEDSDPSPRKQRKPHPPPDRD